MEITVTDRYFFERLRGRPEEEALFKKARVISVNSVRVPERPPFSERYWDAPNVLILFFDDVCDPVAETGRHARAMDESDAEAVARFAASSDPRPVIVHCTAGISRSGAIGVCLDEYYNRKCMSNETEHEIFCSNHRHIAPNSHVMQLLWKRLELGGGGKGKE